MSSEEIKRAIEELGSGWELKDDKIIKSFHFPSFMNAIEIVNDVANIAEKVNHHPIIRINWRTVKFSFYVDAVTETLNLQSRLKNDKDQESVN